MGAVGRNVQLVVLCEDTQHETFIRRFLKRDGWITRRLRVEKSPCGKGAAEQFVRERFPKELSAYRSRKYIEQALIVMLDGDSVGVNARLRSLDNSCRSQKVAVRSDNERVDIFVPNWRIETWFAYLACEDVDETKSDYPELEHPRDCQKFVERLLEMCRSGKLKQPEPPSLRSACREYNKRLR